MREGCLIVFTTYKTKFNIVFDNITYRHSLKQAFRSEDKSSVSMKFVDKLKMYIWHWYFPTPKQTTVPEVNYFRSVCFPDLARNPTFLWIVQIFPDREIFYIIFLWYKSLTYWVYVIFFDDWQPSSSERFFCLKRNCVCIKNAPDCII